MESDRRSSIFLIAVVAFGALAALFGQFIIEHWPPKDPAQLLYGLATATVGPFVGAGLAFIAARRHEEAKLERDNLAAGRHALLTISSWINDFVVYRRGAIESFARKADGNQKLPAWLLGHPHAFHFNDSLRIDFKSLAFLYEGENYPNMYGAVRLAETAYFDLMSRNADMTKAAIQLQELMATQFPAQDHLDIREVERAAGAELIARARDRTRAVATRLVASSEYEYVHAFEVLREALAAHYPQARFPRFGGIPQRLRLEQLPPMPLDLLA